MKITKAMLEKKEACSDGMKWFEENFGNEAGHKELLRKLQTHNSSWSVWVIEKFKLSFLHETFYPDGKMRYRGNYKDGKHDGLYEGFYPDGKTSYRGNYKDGKRDGLHEEFYEDGRIKYRVNYKDGEIID